MSALPEKRIESKLKSELKRIRSCRKRVSSNSCRKSADWRSRPRQKRQSSSQQSASRES